MTIKQIVAANEYLTPPEAAALLRCTRQTLRNWRAAGKGPPYLMRENRVVYPVAQLHAWLAPPAADC